MHWDYDEELPRGFQDADFEMRAMQERANRESALRKKGICCHGSCSCKDDGPATCFECQKVFVSFDALMADRQDKLG